MQVILLQDVKALGKTGDLVKVSDGYARNFILPKKLGVEATSQNLNELKQKRAKIEREARTALEKAQAFAQDIEKVEVTIYAKKGNGGKLFGSVTSKEIAEALKEQLNMDIDKKKVQLSTPIKELGDWKVPVKLYPGVTAQLQVYVKELV